MQNFATNKNVAWVYIQNCYIWFLIAIITYFWNFLENYWLSFSIFDNHLALERAILGYLLFFLFFLLLVVVRINYLIFKDHEYIFFENLWLSISTFDNHPMLGKNNLVDYVFYFFGLMVVKINVMCVNVNSRIYHVWIPYKCKSLTFTHRDILQLHLYCWCVYILFYIYTYKMPFNFFTMCKCNIYSCGYIQICVHPNVFFVFFWGNRPWLALHTKIMIFLIFS